MQGEGAWGTEVGGREMMVGWTPIGGEGSGKRCLTRLAMVLVALAGLSGPVGGSTASDGDQGPPASSDGDVGPPPPETAAGEAGLDRSIAEFRRQVAGLIRDLDSDDYQVRASAASQLSRWAARPELGPVLAEEFQRVLVLSDTSFEVRKRLEGLRRGLPDAAGEPAGEVPDEEIGRLVRQIEDEAYGARLAAAIRLKWLLGQPRMACPIMLRLKGRLGQPGLSTDALRWLEPTYEEARGAWLMSRGGDDALPPVSDTEIRGWIDDLTRPLAPTPPASEAPARRELYDLLARDSYVGRVKGLVQQRLAGADLDETARARLQDLVDLTRPAMAAEFWEGSHLVNVQYLVVGEAKLEEGATRASHFDRINDEVAHCLSGQNLVPGEYPVGVAIPHPSRRGALFQLVNLPTPRRRLGYRYHLKTGEARRLRDLSRRTATYWLARKRPLTDRQLAVLRQLDAREMSALAGAMFHAIDDQPLAATSTARSGPVAVGQFSHHAALCGLLIERGTREAIPGLLRAIDEARFTTHQLPSPLELPWIAGLSIAARDPWPGVDHWLASLLDRIDPLVHGPGDGPVLGATAAALLLDRHHQSPPQFGLQAAGQQWTGRLNFVGYRFAQDDSRQRIRTWWEQKKSGNISTKSNTGEDR